jgi:hypothetical protein
MNYETAMGKKIALNQNDGNFWKLLSESESEKILSNFPNFFTGILYTGKAIVIFEFCIDELQYKTQ